MISALRSGVAVIDGRLWFCVMRSGRCVCGRYGTFRGKKGRGDADTDLQWIN